VDSRAGLSDFVVIVRRLVWKAWRRFPCEERPDCRQHLLAEAKNSSPLPIMEHKQMMKGGNIREQILARLEELEQEFETGQAELDKVEKQRTYLREKMLQISGAIQVLQELLAHGQSGEQQNGSGPTKVWSEPTETRQDRVRNRDADQANQ
jgi:hypothetical protein